LGAGGTSKDGAQELKGAQSVISVSKKGKCFIAPRP